MGVIIFLFYCFNGILYYGYKFLEYEIRSICIIFIYKL